MSEAVERFREIDPETVRKKAGLSQRDMASLMGMSKAGYDDWENGRRQPGGPAYRLLYLLDIDSESVIENLNPHSET